MATATNGRGNFIPAAAALCKRCNILYTYTHSRQDQNKNNNLKQEYQESEHCNRTEIEDENRFNIFIKQRNLNQRKTDGSIMLVSEIQNSTLIKNARLNVSFCQVEKDDQEDDTMNKTNRNLSSSIPINVPGNEGERLKSKQSFLRSQCNRKTNNINNRRNSYHLYSQNEVDNDKGKKNSSFFTTSLRGRRSHFKVKSSNRNHFPLSSLHSFLNILRRLAIIQFFLLYYILMFLQYGILHDIKAFLGYVHIPMIDDNSFQTTVYAWREWDYDTVTETPIEWQETWGYKTGPRGRRGHTLSLDGSRLILFGGRDDDIVREHTPRSFKAQEVEGVRSFTTYESAPLYECNIPENSTWDGNSTYFGECENYVPTALIYNDVWMYDLNCTRYDDESCVHLGWQLLHPGAFNADCRIVIGGREICSMPSERWLHDAIMFKDRTMFIYGGFSQRCEDFCSDIWSFDLRDNTWLEIYENDYFHYTAAPGKRWRFSIVGYDAMMIIFGGHRLWHGYGDSNSWENKWEDLSQYPPGGYLDDLWVYTKELLAEDEVVPVQTQDYGKWEKINRKGGCTSNADGSMDCDEPWPKPRAGHSATIDRKRNGMWIYGGYTTFFPYPSTSFVGAGDGISQDYTISNFIPYSNYPYYLDDFWFYNFTDGMWTELKFPEGDAHPGPRVDHYMILANDVIILFGGFNDNLYYGDTWYYNITGDFWLEKKSFVHALWPDSCTDDLETIRNNPDCTRLNYTKELEREMWEPYNAKDYGDQPYYVPDPNHGAFWGILDKGEEFDPYKAVPVGTPIFPFAANAPRQYARPFERIVNGSMMTLYELCTSVKGEPTRGKIVDGQGGRANGPIFINQPRRQAPGWDGCRDRSDNRTDLPNKLLWSQPTSRSQHRIVYSEEFELGLLYGGQGLQREEVTTKDITMSVNSLNDLWQLNINRCPNNCSFHGSCEYGFCFCDPGFYGVDCSNISCPGEFCYYDSRTNEQICKHCCSAGYTHFDNETWVEDARKVPCSLTEPGEENGVCDGFGTCQCAPPYIGPDCSIRDCPHNCSFNGYCSVEYPVSRCMCLPGYYGDHCQFKQCLNNCSYPNGVCNKITGKCRCEMTYVPFNNTRPWYNWGGEDCSWIVAFAAAPRNHGGANSFIAIVISFVTTILFAFYFLQ